MFVINQVGVEFLDGATGWIALGRCRSAMEERANFAK